MALTGSEGCESPSFPREETRGSKGKSEHSSPHSSLPEVGDTNITKVQGLNRAGRQPCDLMALLGPSMATVDLTGSSSSPFLAPAAPDPGLVLGFPS